MAHGKMDILLTIFIPFGLSKVLLEHRALVDPLEEFELLQLFGGHFLNLLLFVVGTLFPRDEFLLRFYCVILDKRSIKF